jgi:predicted transcriptional regulator of viral defense system
MITSDEILEKVRRRGLIRWRESEALGIPAKHLQRLYEQGLLQRVGRGLYTPVQAEVTEHQTLIEASVRVPHGVICLLSALRFHGLTTQNPFEVWLALPPRARQPMVDYPPLRITRMSGEALTDGIEEHRHGGAVLRVYSPAKTVADCFKFRNKIGLDVALEALRDGWRSKKVTMDELWHCAKIDRVANIIRPYLEALS